MDRLISIRETEDQAGPCRTIIYKKVKDGTFPQPVKIGRSIRFSEQEVQQWIRDQKERRDNARATRDQKKSETAVEAQS